MNFYGSESDQRHSLSGRLIPICGALFNAIGRAANQPFPEGKFVADLPPWVDKVADKLCVTILRSFVEVAPRNKLLNPRMVGRLFGILIRAVAFWIHDAPAKLKAEGLLDLPEEMEKKLDAMSGLPFLLSSASTILKTPVNDEDQLVAAGAEKLGEMGTKVVKNFLSILFYYLSQRPVEEQYNFLRGIPQGFKAFLNFRGEFTGDKRRWEVYQLLFMFWPEIAEMQKAQPPKTRKDLLDWLEKQAESELVKDEKVFFDLCDEIDLDMSPPGHPFGTNSP